MKPCACTNCGRRLEPAFAALSPVAVDGTVRLVPVCHPVCDSPWWTLNSTPDGVHTPRRARNATGFFVSLA